MTKKDYILIAKPFNRAVNALKDLIDNSTKQEQDKQNLLDRFYVIELMVQALSNELLKDNPRFDTNKFYQACGL